MFAFNALLPIAVFLCAVVFALNARLPTAVLSEPVVIASNAPSPIPVFSNASPTSILPALNVAIPAIPIVTAVPTITCPPLTLIPL